MMPALKPVGPPYAFPYHPCPNAPPSPYRGRGFWEVGILGASGSPIITIVAGATTVNLNHPAKWEVYEKAYVAEVGIPGRQGGQVQYLGRPQISYTISGLIDAAAELTGVNGLQALDTVQSSATNATLTLKYGADTIKTDTVRVMEFPYWPIKGSTMYWFGYAIKALAIG